LGGGPVKVRREVDTDDGVITVEVEACEHEVPADEDCGDCEYNAWNA